MPVATIEKGAEFLFQGRSAVSGFRTRLFYDELDAIAEEAWLDRQWYDLRAFWTARVVLRQADMDRRIRTALAMLAQDARLGMQLISLTRQDQVRFGDFVQWLSNEHDDDCNLHVELVSKNALKREWVVRAETYDAQLAIMEGLKAEVVASPLP